MARPQMEIDVIGAAYKKFRAETSLTGKQAFLARLQALAMDLQKELFDEATRNVPATARSNAIKPKQSNSLKADKVSTKKPVGSFFLEGFWNNPKDKMTALFPQVGKLARPRAYPSKSNILLLLCAAQEFASEKRYKGHHTCRLCGHSVGSNSFVRDNWEWPEGLEHYIAKHNVVLTNDFVNFLVKTVGGRFIAKHKIDLTTLRVREKGSYNTTTFYKV